MVTVTLGKTEEVHASRCDSACQCQWISGSSLIGQLEITYDHRAAAAAGHQD